MNNPQGRRDYQRQVSNGTINNYLRNLRAYFAWLTEEETTAVYWHCQREAFAFRTFPKGQELGMRSLQNLTDAESMGVYTAAALPAGLPPPVVDSASFFDVSPAVRMRTGPAQGTAGRRRIKGLRV